MLKFVPALIPVVSLVLSATQGTGKERKIMAHDAEVASQLPEGPARNAVLALVERQAELLGDNSRRRDTPMLVVSLLVATAAWYGTVWLFQLDQWWGYVLSLLCGIVGLLFTYGIFETAKRIPRDDKGHALTSKEPARKSITDRTQEQPPASETPSAGDTP